MTSFAGQVRAGMLPRGSEWRQFSFLALVLVLEFTTMWAG